MSLSGRSSWPTCARRRGGGAPGASGSRFEHHKLLLVSDSATGHFYRAALRLARADVPPLARAALRLGRLTALLKETAPGARRKVRVIVAGQCLRRLVARTLNQQFIGDFDDACAPHQFALGTRAGTDAAALLVKFCCEQGRTIVQTDAKGAYDNASRQRMLEELERVAPALVPFVSLFYSEPSTYLWEDDAGQTWEIPQAEGGEQGDPLMPALFSLVVRGPLAAAAQRLDPGDLLTAFLDDVFLITSRERARASFDVVREELARGAGIELEDSKTRVYADALGPPPPGIAELGSADDPVWRADPALPPAQRGVRVLGMPLGSPEYVAAFLDSRLALEQRLLARLPNVRDPQCEWLLLLLCAEPRANHLLRTVAGPELEAYAEAHDVALRDAFAVLVQYPRLVEVLESCMLLRLPRRYGGLGLRSAVRTAPAAHFAGWAAALPLWQARFPALCATMLRELALPIAGVPCVRAAQSAAAALYLDGWEPPTWPALARGLDAAERAGPGAAAPEPGEWARGWQFVAADARELHVVREFFGALAPTGRALLLNQSGSHAGDGLSAMPVGEDTRARRFLTTLRRRAWLPLGLGGAECPGCGVPLDPCGIHLTSCPDSGRVRSRAAPLERAFMGIAREAGARCRWQPLVRTLNLGPPGEQCAQGDQRQLDFAAFGSDAFGGLPICADATLVSPISADGIPHPGCVTDPDAVFDPAERQIRVDYGDIARGGRAHLFCLASGVGGRWNETALGFVRALVRVHVRPQPAVLRQSVALALTRRWWAVLSVARDEALAASLDPADTVTEHGHPPLDPIDVWLRDPVGPSVLGGGG